MISYWVSFLAYPNLLGIKGFVVFVVHYLYILFFPTWQEKLGQIDPNSDETKSNRKDENSENDNP
jgi:hypothetical protein